MYIAVRFLAVQKGPLMFETDIGEDHEHSASFLYLSVPRYALRELWLSLRARHWTDVEATIQSSTRTKGGTRETIRVDVWYGYKYEERHYAGHLIRDRVLGGVRKVLDRCPEGKKVVASVNPHEPDKSYLPSGLGYIEPILVAVTGIGFLFLFLWIFAALIITSF